MENDKILVKTSEGNIAEYSLLSRFNIENKADEYVIFTDYSKDIDDNINIYSGILLNDGTIKSVEDPEEIALIDNYIQELINSL